MQYIMRNGIIIQTVPITGAVALPAVTGAVRAVQVEHIRLTLG